MRGDPRNKVRDDLMSRGWAVIESHATPNRLQAHRGREAFAVIIRTTPTPPTPGEFTATVTKDGITYNFDPGPVLEKRAKTETA